jgi:hypothetical protein
MRGVCLLVTTLAGIAACDPGADLAGPGEVPTRPSIDPSSIHRTGIMVPLVKTAGVRGVSAVTTRCPEAVTAV